MTAGDPLDELLQRASLLFPAATPAYTDEDIDAGWERLLEAQAAKECALCRRRGTRKRMTQSGDKMWPVCLDKGDCNKHKPRRPRIIPKPTSD